MTAADPDRVTAAPDDGIVVFAIGMRLVALWKVHRWLPIALAMPRMLRELESTADSGLLGHETALSGRTILSLQYWDSFESLRAYATDPDQAHLPAWAAFEDRVGEGGDVGIFHETYVVEPDAHESLYVNMSPFGLGAATERVPAVGDLETAGGRLGRWDDGRRRPPGGRPDG